MKYIILGLTVSSIFSGSAFAEQPGLSTNVILSGPIYAGNVPEEVQRLSLGSQNGDIELYNRKAQARKKDKKRQR